jgi:hypothetical protein
MRETLRGTEASWYGFLALIGRATLVAATLALLQPVARARDPGARLDAERDELRALLYRLDVEARAARIRSSTSVLSAEAAARHADQTARVLSAGDARLREAGVLLSREAEALKLAVHDGEWAEVPDRSAEVQRIVRQLDERLTPVPTQ